MDAPRTLIAPFAGTVVSTAAVGHSVRAGDAVVVLESMKMEHEVTAPTDATVSRLHVAVGDTVVEGQPLADLDAAGPGSAPEGVAVEEARPRADLAALESRRARASVEQRADAVSRLRARGHRTAQENVADLCDPGSFVEYGPLVVAAQTRRRSLDDLIDRTSGDGIVAGVGAVNGDLFPADVAACGVLAYDYTVLAGTQGFNTHRKKDRLLEIVAARRLPLVIYAEGGGGRPGDVDAPQVAHLDVPTFRLIAELSGLVPLVGVVAGFCFAGNAVLLGCCDVIIATADSNIGAGGPAMVEGGGLGVFDPREIGPIADQVASGVVDIAVADEAEATAVARRYLSYFQGAVPDFERSDQAQLRDLVPENRVRAYDVRRVLYTLADTDSVLELREGFGAGIITALARVEGRAIGMIANNPHHLGGAIDVDGADKASRFLQLCDAFGLPVVYLCDTPGIMVGPDAERQGTVRHAARMFVTAASMTVPTATVILRKAYGLGAQAMAAGSFKATHFTVAWPTGEVGGMNLEGAVRLGYKAELDAIVDPAGRESRYEAIVASMYEKGSALGAATFFEVDDVIDPAETRRWIVSMLATLPPRRGHGGGRRPMVDTW